MKTQELLFCLVLLSFSCKQKESKVMKKDTIKKAVTEVIVEEDDKEVKTTPQKPDSLGWKDLQSAWDISRRYKYYDMNGDSFGDSLIHDFFKAEGLNQYKIVNGKNNQALNIDYNSTTAGVIQFPYYYVNPENKLFIEAFLNSIRFKKADKPDPTLQWLMEGTLSNKSLPYHAYIQQIFRFKPRFIKGDFQFPESYYLEVKSDSLLKLCATRLQQTNAYLKPGMINYYTHHTTSYDSLNKTLSLIDSSKIYKVYTLYPNSVIAQKTEGYAWVFISDFTPIKGLMNVPRSNSIGDVRLVNKYLLISYTLGALHTPIYETESTEVYVVDIEKGICVKLKPQGGHFSMVELKSNMLELHITNFNSSKTEVQKLYFPAICNEMDKL